MYHKHDALQCSCLLGNDGNGHHRHCIIRDICLRRRSRWNIGRVVVEWRHKDSEPSCSCSTSKHSTVQQASKQWAEAADNGTIARSDLVPSVPSFLTVLSPPLFYSTTPDCYNSTAAYESSTSFSLQTTHLFTTAQCIQNVDQSHKPLFETFRRGRENYLHGPNPNTVYYFSAAGQPARERFCTQVNVILRTPPPPTHNKSGIWIWRNKPFEGGFGWVQAHPLKPRCHCPVFWSRKISPQRTDELLFFLVSYLAQQCNIYNKSTPM